MRFRKIVVTGARKQVKIKRSGIEESKKESLDQRIKPIIKGVSSNGIGHTRQEIQRMKKHESISDKKSKRSKRNKHSAPLSINIVEAKEPETSF